MQTLPMSWRKSTVYRHKFSEKNYHYECIKQFNLKLKIVFFSDSQILAIKTQTIKLHVIANRGMLAAIAMNALLVMKKIVSIHMTAGRQVCT